MPGDEENALWYVWRGTAGDYVSPGLYMALQTKSTISHYPSLSFRCDYAHLTGCSRSPLNVDICIRYPRGTSNRIFLVLGQTYISKLTIILILKKPNLVLLNMLSGTSKNDTDNVAHALQYYQEHFSVLSSASISTTTIEESKIRCLKTLHYQLVRRET